MEEVVKFDKTYNNDTDSLHFIYEGKINNLDYNEFNLFIDKVFNNLTDYGDIIKDISWIRTIFKDFSEITLEVNYKNEFDSMLVKYNDGILDIYNFEKTFNNNKFKVSYKDSKDINISIPSSITDLSYEERIIIENFSEYIYIISKLKKKKLVELGIDGKLIAQVYKLFFNEDVDFSKPEIKNKIQSMMSILQGIGLSFCKDYSFNTQVNGVAHSTKLDSGLDNLSPLGLIDFHFQEIIINDYYRKVIVTVGNIINEYIGDKENKNMILNNISNIFYVNRYKNFDDSDINKIAHYSNLEVLDINNCIELVKKINYKLSDN